MGFDDALNKAKDFAKDNPDKVDKGLDSASDQAKSRVGDEHHDKIDGAGDTARDRLGLGDQDDKGGKGGKGGNDSGDKGNSR